MPHSLGLWISRSFALLLLALIAYAITLFPVYNVPLLFAAGIYFLGMCLLPSLWMLVLPVLFVVLDLTPFSGRLVFNELDFFVFTTLAYGLFRGDFFSNAGYQSKLRVTVAATFLLFAALSLSGMSNALKLLQPLETNAYYTWMYGYKVSKGIIWGFCLSLMWQNYHQTQPQKARNSVLAGCVLAGFALFLIILWERETLSLILTLQPWYHIATSLLDFTSSYRITAWFSDMHTGGESIDGMMLLLLTLSMGGIIAFKSFYRIFALLGFAVCAYAILTGFTRATYASLFLGMALFPLLTLRETSATIKTNLLPLLTALAGIIAGIWAFRSSSYFGLLGYSLAITGTAIFSSRNLSVAIRWTIALLATGIGLALIPYGHLNSRWVTPDGTTLASSIVAVLVVLFMLTTFDVVPKTHSRITYRLLTTTGISIISLIIGIATGGYQINSRIVTAGQDMQTRLDHWSNVLATFDRNTETYLFGMGAGTFAGNYAVTFPETLRTVGSFTSIEEGGNHLLHLSSGEDLAFGQRLPIEGNQTYTFSAKIKAEVNTSLAVFLCERNEIYASNFIANCQAKSLRIDAAPEHWQTILVDLDSTNVGAKPITARWPTLIYLKNFSEDNVLALDDLSLTRKGSQTNLILNGSFESGLDHWYFYNDFQHLPWHIKNQFLNIFYDMGGLGLTAFLICLGVAIRNTLVLKTQTSLAERAFKAALLTGIVCVLTFGLFGSPLDSPRPATLFYFALFTLMLSTQKVSTSERHISDENV